MEKVGKKLKQRKKLGITPGFICAGIWIFNLKHLNFYTRQTTYSAYSLLYSARISQNQNRSVGGKIICHPWSPEKCC